MTRQRLLTSFAIIFVVGILVYPNMPIKYAVMKNDYVDDKLMFTKEETQTLYNYVKEAMGNEPFPHIPATASSVKITFHYALFKKPLKIAILDYCDPAYPLIATDRSLYIVDIAFYKIVREKGEENDYPMTD